MFTYFSVTNKNHTWARNYATVFVSADATQTFDDCSGVSTKSRKQNTLCKGPLYPEQFGTKKNNDEKKIEIASSSTIQKSKQSISDQYIFTIVYNSRVRAVHQYTSR